MLYSSAMYKAPALDIEKANRLSITVRGERRQMDFWHKVLVLLRRQGGPLITQYSCKMDTTFAAFNCPRCSTLRRIEVRVNLAAQDFLPQADVGPFIRRQNRRGTAWRALRDRARLRFAPAGRQLL